MHSRLRWHYATAEDVADIQTFTCCRKVRRTPPFGSWNHPEPWAHKAQSLAHNCGPRRAPDYLLLGRDRHSDRLQALVRWSESADGTGAVLMLLCVSLNLHGQGYGKEAMNQVLDELTTHVVERGVEVVHIVGEVHPYNDASLGLLTRTGFQYHERKNDHQVWALDLLIAGTEPLIFTSRGQP